MRSKKAQTGAEAKETTNTLKRACKEAQREKEEIKRGRPLSKTTRNRVQVKDAPLGVCLLSFVIVAVRKDTTNVIVGPVDTGKET